MAKIEKTYVTHINTNTLSTAADLGEGKLKIQTSFTPLKNDLVSHLASG